MNSYYNYREAKASRFIDSIRHELRRFPANLHLALTDNCFNKCIMCDHWKRPNRMTIDYKTLSSFLLLGMDRGLSSVCFSGGDPFAYGPRLNDLMKKCIVGNVSFGLICAGIIPHWVDMHVLAAASWVRVSLDSIDDYDGCRGGATFEDVDKGITRMLNYGVNVAIGATLHSANTNINNIHNLVMYAIKKSIRQLRFWIVRRRDEMLANYAAINPVLDWARAHLSHYGIDNNIDWFIEAMKEGEVVRFRRCRIPLIHSFVDSSGAIAACCILGGETELGIRHDPFGNINDLVKGNKYGWESVYAKAKRFSESPLMPICKKECIARYISVNEYLEHHIGDGAFI